MPATRIHLVRHGEVRNPERVVYGRLPNFPLTELGEQMARQAAYELRESKTRVVRLIASPLERTLQSAKAIAEQFNVPIETEEEIIEPSNMFEGHSVNFKTLVRNPKFLLRLYNPFQPSWGEAYLQIQNRMLDAMNKAWHSTQDGEVVMVSHQLPIWVVHRFTMGQRLSHDPRSRRCELSSITSFELRLGNWIEVDYRDPAKALRMKTVDQELR